MGYGKVPPVAFLKRESAQTGLSMEIYPHCRRFPTRSFHPRQSSSFHFRSWAPSFYPHIVFPPPCRSPPSHIRFLPPMLGTACNVVPFGTALPPRRVTLKVNPLRALHCLPLLPTQDPRPAPGILLYGIYGDDFSVRYHPTWANRRLSRTKK